MASPYDAADKKYFKDRSRELKARALAFTFLEADLRLTQADVTRLMHATQQDRDELAFFAGVSSPSDGTWAQLIGLLEDILHRQEEA